MEHTPHSEDPGSATPHSEGQSNGLHRNGTSASYASRFEDQGEDEVSLHDIIEILLKGKWLILVCFLFVLAAVAFFTFHTDREYEAYSTVYVSNGQSSPQLGQILGIEGNGTSRNLSNEIELLRSRRIALQVADKLMDIEKVPGSDQVLSVLVNDEGKRLGQLTVAERLRRTYVRAEPVREGVDFIKVTAVSTIPDEAMLISELYVEEYVNYNRTTSRARMSASREFLSEQAARFDSVLTQSEEQVRQFQAEANMVAPLEQEASRLLQQLASAQQQRFSALVELNANQTELDALKAELERIVPGLAQAISTNSNQFIQGLIGRITQLQIEIEEKLTKNPGLRGNEAQDPQLVEKRRQLVELQQELAAKTKQLTEEALSNTSMALQSSSVSGALGLVASLQQQIMQKEIEEEVTQARMNMLSEATETYESDLNAIPDKQLALTRLQRSMSTSERLFNTLSTKLQEARIAEQSELGYVEIVDRAIKPGAPVRPKVRLNLMVGAVLGLIIGIGLAFGRNAIDNRVHKPEDLRKHGQSVIGVVPNLERIIKTDFGGREQVTVDGHTYSTRLISLLNPLSPMAESYRRLRTNIQFSRADKVAQTILVTSSGPGEGKTVTAMNLAVTMAQGDRRTLFIDADLRRPTGHRMMGIPREPGLVELIFESFSSDTGPPDMEPFATTVDKLYVVPSGKSVPNPAEILGSKRMRDLLEQLRETFDVIVIDTPPVLAVTDAILLSTQCDATVMVASANETNWHALNRSLEALHGVGAKVIGILLNRFDAKAAYGGYGYSYGYGYGYGYGYYDYYGEKQEGKKVRS